MRFETFTGTDLRRVFDGARATLGEDAMIVRSDVTRKSGATRVEVIAARPDDVQRLRQRLTPPAPRLPRSEGGRGRSGPFIIALIGPTGAGKTTTAAKLALHDEAFGARKVGFLTLDTYRVGALEQMQTFAEISGLPLEVVYDAREVIGALKRLDDCDVVVVDTPGRSPRAQESNAHWQALLARLSPNEVHLVVPASIRPDIAGGLITQFERCAPTHLLITKVDETPDESGLAALAGNVDLPTRWLTDGQVVPDDLSPARGRLLASLGLTDDSLANAVVAA
jgi:flagellar biosynthesis protein FlhF